jgi:hypothetical protein
MYSSLTATSFTANGTLTSGTTSVIVNCNINAATATFSGNCGPFASSGNPTAVNAALAGASQTSTRNEVQLSNSVLSNHIEAVSRDIALSLGGAAQGAALPQTPHSGISAGSDDLKWDVWVDGSGSYLNNSSAVAASNGYSVVALTGIDYKYSDAWVFGFDAGYVRSDLNVNATAGPRVANGAQLGPYLSYVINEHLSIDGSFQYTRNSNNITGNNGLGLFTSTAYDSNRYNPSVGLDAFDNWNGFRFTGNLGYSYAVELPTSSVPLAIGGAPTSVHDSAITIGGAVDYPIGSFDPFIPVSVSYETTPTRDGTGRAGLTFGAGTRYDIADTVHASFQVTTEQLRSHSQNVVGEASLRVNF